MKKWVWFILLIFIFVLNLLPKQEGYLKGLMNPDSMKVDNDILYVMDGASVLTYSLKDFKLRKRFGNRGEGPGELTTSPFWSNQISPHKGNLFLEGLRKFMLVKKDGKVLYEKRKTKRFLKMLPVGNNYVVRTFPFQREGKKFYSAVKIVNSRMEDIKELVRLYSESLSRGGNQFPITPDSVSFCVYQGKIYLEDSRFGFLIKVFDSQGSFLYEIKKESAKTRITQDIIRREQAHMRESFKQKRLSVTVPIHIGQGGWKKFKTWAKFIIPKYLPTIKDILVKNNRIYLQTFNKRGDHEEYIILNLKGKLIKKVWLPQLKSFALYDSYMLGAGIKFYDFNGDSFIYLEEDEEKEDWKICQVAF